MYDVFRLRLLKTMKEQNISQKDLAITIGVTEASMSRYVNGNRMPKTEILANIATALKTTSDYLLGVEKENEIEFPRIKRLLARNSGNMTLEQKRELINVLLDGEKK